MGRKWFTIAVGIMWLTSMSWLVRTKLLPQMLAGPAPSNATVYTNSLEADAKVVVPVGWELSWGTKPLGWAVSSSHTNPEGFTEIKSHSHFENLPVEEFLPVFFRGVLGGRSSGIGDLKIEAESRLVIDGEGKLNRMTFVVGNSLNDEPIRIDGRVEADKIYISIYNGGSQRTTSLELSANAIVGNDLTPMVRMPNLYVGRTWNVPVYSMFAIGSTSLMEVLRAEVESESELTWNNMRKRVWFVVMRRDSGSLLGGARTPRGKMWVDIETGMILQQETMHGNSKLVFTRASQENADAYLAHSIKLRNRRTQELLELPPDKIPEPRASSSLWSRAARGFFREHSQERRRFHYRADPWAEFDPAMNPPPDLDEDSDSAESNDLSPPAPKTEARPE